VIIPAALLTAYSLVPEPPYGAHPFDDAWRRHLLIGIAIVLWVAALLISRRLPRPVPLLGPLLLLLIVQAVSAAAASDWRIGVEPILNLAAGIVIFAALVDCPGLNARSLRWSLLLTAFLLAIACLAFVWGRFLDWRALVRAVPDAQASLLPPTVPRDLGTGTNPNIVAPLMAFVAPLYLLSVVESRGMRRRWLLLGASLIVQTAIFFTLSRSAWLGEATGLGVTALLLLLSSRQAPHLTSRRLVAGSLLAGAAAGIAIVTAVVLLSAGWRPQWLFRPTIGARNDFRMAAMAMIRQHPILGDGPGSFVLNYPYVSDGDPVGAVHSHNVLVQLAVESGLLGVLAAALVAIMAARIVWLLWRHGSTRDRRLAAAVTGGLTVFLVSGSADALHLFPEILFGLGMLMAMAIRAQSKSAKEPRNASLDASWLIGFIPFALAALLLAGWTKIDRSERHYDRSITLASQHRWLESASEAGSAAELDPAEPAYLNQQALSLEMAYENHQSLDGRDRAVSLLRRSLDLEPRSAMTQLDLAALLASSGQQDAALAEAPLMVAGAPRDSLVLLAAGVLEEPQQADHAIQDYAGAMAQSPRIASSEFWRATAFRRDHYLEIVRAALDRASSEDSSGGPGAVRQIISAASGVPISGSGTGAEVADLERIRSQIRDGELETAESSLIRAVRERPDDPAVRLALGELYQRRGDLPRARGQWLAGAYLGDVESIMDLGDSSPGGRVPAKVVELGQWGLADLWDRQFGLAVQHYRFAYRRQEPLPIVLPGDWLNALPPLYPRLRASVERWQDQPLASTGSQS
jgi:O-antigen ligase/tetratricopeptide (TPR) repeat protein